MTEEEIALEAEKERLRLEAEAADPDDLDDPEELPLFMQEEDVPEAKKTDGSFSKEEFIGMKDKLKGKVREGNEELEKLRAENEQLKQSSAKPVIEAVKRPKINDFDTDEEYDVALEKYEDERAQKVYNAVQSKGESEATVRKFQERVTASVDSHFDRAAALVEKHSISPEVYQQATETVKSAINEIVPGTFDFFIDLIGEGSEKTVFAMGRNKTKLSVLKEKLHDDKSGLKAAFYLGQETARLNGVNKQTSRAPAPAAQIKGDGVTKTDGKQRKEFDKLIDAGQTSKAFSLMRKAKKDGVDTKEWRK